MQESPPTSPPPVAGPKRFAQRLLTYGGNRLELLMLELEEERHHFLRVSILALGAAVFALLAGMGFTAAIVVSFWQTSPVTVLVVLGVCYSVAAILLYRRVVFVQHDWRPLSATQEQLQKDGECLKELLN